MSVGIVTYQPREGPETKTLTNSVCKSFKGIATYLSREGPETRAWRRTLQAVP